jgi:asparagine synthase (glutamine-hydrolysing)
MCGIAGFFPCSSSDNNLSILGSMSAALSHRGPDGKGVWSDGIVGFAHSRLSIFDLDSGSQPMHSSSKRYVISYNGEVYNFISLRKKLISKGVSFRTNTDTEVVLESIQFWGLKKALSLFHGMFAFALWDCNKHILTLVRDRMGEKPLYYGWCNKTFIFASELKSMKCHPNWDNTIDHDALSQLMQYNYIPAPLSIYKGVNKLEPGTLISFNLKNNSFKSIKERWFDYSSEVKIAKSQIYPGTFKNAVNDLDVIMNKVIEEQGKADVPVGVFLSGGLDSSLISAIMQSQSDIPINTFTMGYENSDYDESMQALKYSKYLGTSHTEMTVTSNDALSIVPELSSIYDEPFADASQIPTLLVSKLAKKKVKVALSGDGADEMFGGYNRYIFGDSIYHYMKFAPSSIRRIISQILKLFPPTSWDKCFLMLNKILNQNSRISHPGEKIHKISSLLLAKNENDFYSKLVSIWYENNPVITQNKYKSKSHHNLWNKKLNLVDNMMHIDSVAYLPDDILVKVDRASMSVGLESRAPFLDHEVVNFAMKLPLNYKIDNKKGKLILRNVLNNYIPETIHAPNKKGFSAPIHDWIRGPLREWAEDLLSEETLRNQGLFDVDLIRGVWKNHLSNKNNNQYQLWSVLMFQSWLEYENKKTSRKLNI